MIPPRLFLGLVLFSFNTLEVDAGGDWHASKRCMLVMYRMHEAVRVGFATGLFFLFFSGLSGACVMVAVATMGTFGSTGVVNVY